MDNPLYGKRLKRIRITSLDVAGALTHWGRNKMDAISKQHIQMHFL